MLTRLTAMLTSLLVGLVLFAPAAAAFTVDPGARFNDPAGTKEARTRLMTHVDSAIVNTPKRETILISTYFLDRKTSVTKLLAARKRGVSVQVVLDGDIAGTVAARLEKSLNADNTKRLPAVDPFTGKPYTDPLPRSVERGGADRSFSKRCLGSCRGGGGNMHSKFFAFSKSGTSTDVVMISSANLNLGGQGAGYNDLYTMSGRPATYAKFAGIHNEMVDDTRGDGDRYTSLQDGLFESRFFPMITATKATDPTMRDLSQIRCRGATGGAGVRGRTTINVAMFFWAGPRGMYIAKRLLRLQRQGCLVSIIYGAPSKQVAGFLRPAARRGLINVYDSRRQLDTDPEVDLRMHAKYLLINGSYAGDTSAWRVITGSANWVTGSLTRSDELQLRIEGRPAHANYLRNWRSVRAVSRRVGG